VEFWGVDAYAAEEACWGAADPCCCKFGEKYSFISFDLYDLCWDKENYIIVAMKKKDF
jgi:hypothetical protein